MAGLAFLVSSFPSFAQNIDVRGVVKDVQGVPVAGAGVFVMGLRKVRAHRWTENMSWRMCRLTRFFQCHA